MPEYLKARRLRATTYERDIEAWRQGHGWKRIPGGDYVYPVQVTVLALTAKRVKIKADDDGEIVIRYVPTKSLQRQE